MNELVMQSEIKSRIYTVRGKEVMLDEDLAELYEVETRVFNQAVKRNKERFPDDFMFQLSEKEYEKLRSQFVISSSSHGGRRYLPYVFTEQGVYMLSAVLKSKVAIEVSIEIMRTFAKIREFSLHYNALAKQIMELERKHNKKFKEVFEQLDAIVSQTQKADEKVMGFIREED
ncbi:MAG: ORF6N domain-containing protein [Campylobacterales bacterium]|nr:ORF6N domain-containing protein [Campylobacterales bacterium]HEO98417.1 ORF6N domain-containing protein [Campylobacterota bacterium]